MMKKLLSLLLFCYIALLYGCATQIEPPFDHANYQNKPWKQRRLNLSQTTQWDIEGAASIQNQGRTQIGSFNWKQRGQHYTINFYGPLNLGMVSIQGQPGQVALLMPTGTYYAPTPEALMRQRLGWYLPVSNMFYWIRGLPAKGPSAKQMHDTYGHLVFLQQQGWQIQFDSFQSYGTVDLPRKIVMQNQALHLKFVIKHWSLNAQDDSG